MALSRPRTRQFHAGSSTAAAAADEVEAVGLDLEAGVGGRPGQALLEGALELGSHP